MKPGFCRCGNRVSDEVTGLCEECRQQQNVEMDEILSEFRKPRETPEKD